MNNSELPESFQGFTIAFRNQTILWQRWHILERVEDLNTVIKCAKLKPNRERRTGRLASDLR